MHAVCCVVVVVQTLNILIDTFKIEFYRSSTAYATTNI